MIVPLRSLFWCCRPSEPAASLSITKTGSGRYKAIDERHTHRESIVFSAVFYGDDEDASRILILAIVLGKY